MNDIMLDIETLGTGNNSIVIQIGAVYFNRDAGELGKELSVNITLQSCFDVGLKADSGSLKFWFNQPQPYSWLNSPIDLNKALQLLREFYDKKALVWSHSTFDFPRLAEAYTAIGQGFALPYRNLRDIRTLVDLSGIEYKKDVKGDPKNHDALDDCKYQVKYCVKAFDKLKQKMYHDVSCDCYDYKEGKSLKAKD